MLTFVSKYKVMQCKVGDTVRFLNEVGGGVISRIINAKLVSVRDEDGFQIPVLISDIVVVSSAEAKPNQIPVQKESTVINKIP